MNGPFWGDTVKRVSIESIGGYEGPAVAGDSCFQTRSNPEPESLNGPMIPAILCLSETCPSSLGP